MTFYEELLARTAGPHGDRLRSEAQRTRQPFGGARQHLNHELARRRAILTMAVATSARCTLGRVATPSVFH